MLKTVKISQAQALQRTGRAGRESEGHCYRMLTKAEFDRLPANTTPEILRYIHILILITIIPNNVCYLGRI